MTATLTATRTLTRPNAETDNGLPVKVGDRVYLTETTNFSIGASPALTTLHVWSTPEKNLNRDEVIKGELGTVNNRYRIALGAFDVVKVAGEKITLREVA